MSNQLPLSNIHQGKQLSSPPKLISDITNFEAFRDASTYLASIPPYLFASVLRKICEQTLAHKKLVLPLDEEVPSIFEIQTLFWVNHQVVGKDCPLSFDQQYWKRAKMTNSWLDVVLNGLYLYPKSSAFVEILPLMITDLKFDYLRLFRLIDICKKSESPHLETAIKTGVTASLILPAYRFSMLNALKDLPTHEQTFIDLSKTTLLSEAYNIADFSALLNILVQKKLWTLVKTCVYRIITLIENQNSRDNVLPFIEHLIQANIQLGEVDQIISNYQKYWFFSVKKQSFSLAGELVFSLHATNPHHPIISHVCNNLNQEELSKGLEEGKPLANLLKIKQLEFQENWEAALVYYQLLLAIEKPDWQIMTACFLANNALHTDQTQLIRQYVLPLINNSPLKEELAYRPIENILKICIMDELNNETALRLCRRTFHNKTTGKDIQDAELLPEENVVFSDFLTTRILECLLLSNNLAAFDKSLKQKITIRRLPDNDRLFLENLIQIEDHLRLRSGPFKEETLQDFIYDFERALHILLDSRQLEILAEKFIEADAFIPKDKFGDYHYLDAILVKHTLLGKVAFYLEKCYKNQSPNLTELIRQKYDNELREMTIYTISKNIRNYK